MLALCALHAYAYGRIRLLQGLYRLLMASTFTPKLLILPLVAVVLIGLTAYQALDWQSVDTENLRIHYRAGSVAAQDLDKIKIIYERTFVAARQFLPENVPTMTIDVYLYDELKERAYADPEQRSIHIMYGPRYRLTSLHEFLLVLFTPLNPDVPPGFSLGLYQSQSKLRHSMQLCIEHQNRNKQPEWPQQIDIGHLLTQAHQNREQKMLAGAFVRFLLEELGEEKFWDFYLKLRPDNWRPLLGTSLGRDENRLAQDFRNFLAEKITQTFGVR